MKWRLLFLATQVWHLQCISCNWSVWKATFSWWMMLCNIFWELTELLTNVSFDSQVLPKRTNMPGISTTDRGGHRGGHTRGRGRGYRPPRYQNSSRGRFRYQSSRPQHQSPHPYYGGPSAGKRQWGHMDYHEQTTKRYPCLLLITPPSEDLGAAPSGQHYPQQR